MRFLIRPVRYGVVVNYLGQLMVFLGVAIAVPALIGLVAGEWTMLAGHLAVGALVSVVGLLLRGMTSESAIRPVEAFVVGGLIYLVATLCIAPTLRLGGLGWSDALFEGMSSWTTTGLSIIPDTSSVPRALLFARAWMQWCGGLGVVVLTIAVLVPPGSSASRLLATQVEKGDILPSAVFAARTLSSVYIAATAGAVVLLLLSGMGPFDAICHGLSGVSTGGFSTYNASLTHHWLPTLLVLLPVMALGAWPLPLFRQILRRNPGAVREEPQVPVLMALMVAWIAVFVLLFRTTDARLGAGPRDAIFLGVSLQSGTGYRTIEPAQLSSLGKLVMLVPMNIGGCIGSTAGAIKIYRLLVLFQLFRMTVYRTALRPHVLKPFLVAGRPLSRDEVESVAFFVLAYLGLLGLTAALFTASGYPTLDSLFECASALGASGFSVGLVQPSLPTWLKFVLMFNMWVGRIELIPAVLILYPRIWFLRRRR